MKTIAEELIYITYLIMLLYYTILSKVFGAQITNLRIISFPAKQETRLTSRDLFSFHQSIRPGFP